MNRIKPAFFVLYLLCNVFILWLPAVCLASDQAAGVYELGEVIVSEKHTGVESIGTVREVTTEDIQNMGARTLDEAIDLLPGVNVRTANQGIPRVAIRGFRSKHVILLLDGIPFNSTSDGQFDPSIIPVENIARIKVSYGNHSVLYGEGGLGGVINIITKKGEAGVHGSVAGEAGERDSQLGKATLSGATERTDFFVSGSWHDTDGFPLSDDFDSDYDVENGGLRENSDRERKNAFANLGFSSNERLKMGLIFNYVNSDYGIPPNTIDDKNDDFAKKVKYERVDDLEGYSAQFSAAYDLPGPVDIRGWAYANRLDEDVNRYNDDQYDSVPDNLLSRQENRTDIQGATLQTRYDLNRQGLLTAGVSIKNQDFESDLESRKKTKDDFKYSNSDEDLTTWSAALEYEVNPIDKLGITLGYSYHWLDQDSGPDDDKGSFLIGAYYDLTQDTRIRGSVAEKIRFPSISQLYDTDKGNPDLDAEESTNYEIALEQTLPMDSTISLTGFYIDVDNYISNVLDENGDEIYMNSEKYRFQGVEIIAETHFIPNMMLRAGYTYLDTDDKSSEFEEVNYNPEHKFTLEGKYTFDFGLSLYASLNHLADQYYYADNAVEEGKATPKRELGDFTLVDIKLNQSLLNKQLDVYLGVDNLLDEDYEESYGIPLAGQVVYGGMEFRF